MGKQREYIGDTMRVKLDTVRIQWGFSDDTVRYRMHKSKNQTMDIQKSNYGYPKIDFWISENVADFWISII